MAKNLFSIPIFFIVFRETLEAAIIISVLLGLVEQIAHSDSRVSTLEKQEANPNREASERLPPDQLSKEDVIGDESASNGDQAVAQKRLLKKMRTQIFLGSAVGFFIALAIGAAFIAVWFTQASNLWAKSENLWEGIFSLIAAILIFVMGVTMLKMDRAKLKWRIKLQRTFDGKGVDGRTNTGRWVLFILPLVTILREGMEAVIFVGGVSLGQPATSIPIAAIVGIICGLVIGYMIYAFASRAALTVFMVVMTNVILLIGAGLFSKSIGSIEKYRFNKLLGQSVDDTGGVGPGSYDVRGNVWHLACCSPDDYAGGGGWVVFGALFGWTNNATLGTVLGYVFYWIAVIFSLIVAKWKEGRVKIFGFESPAALKRRQASQVPTNSS